MIIFRDGKEKTMEIDWYGSKIRLMVVPNAYMYPIPPIALEMAIGIPRDCNLSEINANSTRTAAAITYGGTVSN